MNGRAAPLLQVTALVPYVSMNNKTSIGIDASRALQGIRTRHEQYSANPPHALADLPEQRGQRLVCFVTSPRPAAAELFGYELPPIFALDWIKGKSPRENASHVP